MESEAMLKAPFFGISRHRIGVDGEGVTTLAAFHSCPLRCRYCLNPLCLDSKAKVQWHTAESLYKQLFIDNLYFIATGGGVCFGGGEPLLYPEFIQQFRNLCGKLWKITVESSLNVPLASVLKIAPLVNDFIIDIKDMNDEIYVAYTRKSNIQVMENLKWLSSHTDSKHIVIRVPLIPEYNTVDDVERSIQQLQDMGFTHFDRFTHIIR